MENIWILIFVAMIGGLISTIVTLVYTNYKEGKKNKLSIVSIIVETAFLQSRLIYALIEARYLRDFYLWNFNYNPEETNTMETQFNRESDRLNNLLLLNDKNDAKLQGLLTSYIKHYGPNDDLRKSIRDLIDFDYTSHMDFEGTRKDGETESYTREMLSQAMIDTDTLVKNEVDTLILNLEKCFG